MTHDAFKAPKPKAADDFGVPHVSPFTPEEHEFLKEVIREDIKLFPKALAMVRARRVESVASGKKG